MTVLLKQSHSVNTTVQYTTELLAVDFISGREEGRNTTALRVVLYFVFVFFLFFTLDVLLRQNIIFKADSRRETVKCVRV